MSGAGIADLPKAEPMVWHYVLPSVNLAEAAVTGDQIPTVCGARVPYLHWAGDGAGELTLTGQKLPWCKRCRYLGAEWAAARDEIEEPALRL